MGHWNKQKFCRNCAEMQEQKVRDIEKIHVRKKFWPSNFYENKWKIRSQRDNIYTCQTGQNNLKKQSHICTRIQRNPMDPSFGCWSMAKAVQLFGNTACPDLDERHRPPGNSPTSLGLYTRVHLRAHSSS